MKYSRRTCKLPSAAVNTVLTLRVSYVPLSFIRQSCRIQTKRSKRKTQEKKKRVLRRPRRKSRTDTSHKSMKYLVYKKKKKREKQQLVFLVLPSPRPTTPLYRHRGRVRVRIQRVERALHRGPRVLPLHLPSRRNTHRRRACEVASVDIIVATLLLVVVILVYIEGHVVFLDHRVFVRDPCTAVAGRLRPAPVLLAHRGFVQLRERHVLRVDGLNRLRRPRTPRARRLRRRVARIRWRTCAAAIRRIPVTRSAPV